MSFLASNQARAMLNRQVCVSSTKNPLASLILGAASLGKLAASLGIKNTFLTHYQLLTKRTLQKIALSRKVSGKSINFASYQGDG